MPTPVTHLPDPVGAHSLDIGFDLDGVMYDFVGALRSYISASTGRPAETMPDPTCWNFFADDWGMSLDQFLAACTAGVDAGVIFRVGDPYPGAAAGTAALLAAGHRVHIVTDRASMGAPGFAAQHTSQWLAQHNITFTSLTVTADKRSVHTDAFIEDRPENYLALREYGVDAFLRTHAYNEHVDTPPARRVADIDSFVAAVLSPSR